MAQHKYPKTMAEREFDMRMTYIDKDGHRYSESFDWEDFVTDGIDFNELIPQYFADGCSEIALQLKVVED